MNMIQTIFAFSFLLSIGGMVGLYLKVASKIMKRSAFDLCFKH